MMGRMAEETKVNIRALAQLARIEVSDAELAKLETEIPAILAFVEMIKSVSDAELLALRGLGGEVRNVVRADENPHESGIYTEDLLAAAPARERDRIAVKQVISRKQVGS